jgi:hypothetical protein
VRLNYASKKKTFALNYLNRKSQVKLTKHNSARFVIVQQNSPSYLWLDSWMNNRGGGQWTYLSYMLASFSLTNFEFDSTILTTGTGTQNHSRSIVENRIQVIRHYNKNTNRKRKSLESLISSKSCL